MVNFPPSDEAAYKKVQLERLVFSINTDETLYLIYFYYVQKVINSLLKTCRSALFYKSVALFFVGNGKSN